MELYKVILADDEAEIREGMAHRVDWEGHGFEVVGLASHGLEALDLIDVHQPDVLITDIQMPFLNGLELIEQALERVPTLKVIVFSGYDNFEYAQQAISLHVTSYLLKPFSAKDFEATLFELKIQMDTEWHAKRNIKELEETYCESLPALKEKYLVNCLMGHTFPTNSIFSDELLGTEITNNRYSVAVVYLERRIDITKTSLFKDREELLPLVAKKIADSVLSPYTRIESILLGDYLVLVIPKREDVSLSLTLRLLNEIGSELQTVTGMTYFIGLGQPYQGMSYLNQSYQEALDALDYSFMLQGSDQTAIFIKDVDTKKQAMDLRFSEKTEREFRQIVSLGTKEQIKMTLDNLFQPLETESMTFKEYQVYLIELLVCLMKLINTQELDKLGHLEEEISTLLATIDYYKMSEMKTRLYEICLTISDSIQSQAEDSVKLTIKEAKRIVTTTYHQADLSLEQMSAQLYLSSTYFSSLFKKETGISFIEYLTEVRLTKAVELLQETNKKTYEITELIGYQDANYFSYVFKKKYGISPINYRKKYRAALKKDSVI